MCKELSADLIPIIWSNCNFTFSYKTEKDVVYIALQSERPQFRIQYKVALLAQYFSSKCWKQTIQAKYNCNLSWYRARGIGGPQCRTAPYFACAKNRLRRGYFFSCYESRVENARSLSIRYPRVVPFFFGARVTRFSSCISFHLPSNLNFIRNR